MVTSFLPVGHCDTLLSGISKAGLLPTSKLKTLPLNLAVPQFHPLTLNYFSAISCE